MLPLLRRILPTTVTFFFLLLCFQRAFAQQPQHYIRIARIVVDSMQLDKYKAALKAGVESAIQKEPGVLQLYAVYDKQQPTHVTVFEIYASVAAYQRHIKTEHFKKYKETVQSMVKSLELTDVEPIALGKK